jgi:large subunit ribosomal protein L22
MKASLSNYRQAPRKTRLVTDLIKGKSVPDAMTALKFLDKRAAGPVAKLLQSAVANAEKQGEDGRTLIVRNITVNKGLVMMRSMPRAFGRSSPIRHRTSHIEIMLGKGKAATAPAKAKTKAPAKKKAK